MKAKGLFLLHFVFILAKVTCQNITIPLGTYEDPETNIFMNFISRSQVEIWKFNKPDSSRKVNYMSGGYRIIEDNGINFLTVIWSNNTNEKYLIITSNENGYLLLYKSNARPYFWGSYIDTNINWMDYYGDSYLPPRGGMLPSPHFGYSEWISASSSLSEGRISYSPGKLGLAIGECWVESANGYGINERLTLKPSIQIDGSKIYLSSGFVSFLKPYLYKENTRIKKIRVSNASGKSKIFELRDTPNFQALDLSGLLDGETVDEHYRYTIFIDILEVYPGTKYADTCLNSVYYTTVQ
jgi:hypothetical protein